MNYNEAVEFVSSQSHEDEWDDEWEYPQYEDSMEELPNELWEELVPREIPVPAKRIQPKTWAWAGITLIYVLWWVFIAWYM